MSSQPLASSHTSIVYGSAAAATTSSRSRAVVIPLMATHGRRAITLARARAAAAASCAPRVHVLHSRTILLIFF